MDDLKQDTLDTKTVPAEALRAAGLNAPAGLAYPHLTAMSTDDLASMLRYCSQYPENADFTKAISKEIARRKPSPIKPAPPNL